MSRTITGTLHYPDGTALGTGNLRFTAADTSANVLEGVSVDILIAANGTYTVTLLNGSYLVYLTDDSVNNTLYLGKVLVTTGNNISLEELLTDYSTTVPTSIQDYVDSAIETAGEGYQEIGDYIITGYDLVDIPTNPAGLSLTQISRVVASQWHYDIAVTWDASTNISGVDIVYDVVWEGETEGTEGAATGLSNLTYTIPNVLTDETYTIELYAYSRPSGRPAESSAIGTITPLSQTVEPLDPDDISISSGLKYISLRWSVPNPLLTQRVKVYSDTTIDFTPDDASNMIYWGEAPVYIYPVSDTVARYFKFIVIDYRGYSSSVTTYPDPVAGIKISETTIGQIIEDNTIKAQQLVDGIDLSEKLGAHTIVAGKLAVLNLTNLVDNNDFTLYDEDNSTHNSWDYGTTVPINPGPDGYIVLPANASIDNAHQFHCTPGDKFYLSVTLTWNAAAGPVDKGINVVFLDIDDNELNPDDTDGNEITTGYVATNTDSAAETDKLVYGFCLAPATAIKGYVQLKTSPSITTNITFASVVCRFGSAVLIEDGEITADKINVLDLFAMEITINNGGSIQIGENPSVSGGIIMGDQIGLVVYDSSGNTVVFLSPDGEVTPSYFSGKLQAASIESDNTLTGAIELGSNQGFIRTYGKDNEADPTPGFFIGYDPAQSRQAFSIGSSAAYLKWNGNNGLRIKGSLEIGASSGDAIYSANKTSYNDSTAGFWLGDDSGTPKFNIGNATDYLKWNGSNLTLSGDLASVGGSISGVTGSFGNINCEGNLVVGSSGKIYSSGKTSYNSPTAGFFLGYSSGYKLGIGDANNYMQWDGTNLKLSYTGTLYNGEQTGTWNIYTSGGGYSTKTTSFDLPTALNAYVSGDMADDDKLFIIVAKASEISYAGGTVTGTIAKVRAKASLVSEIEYKTTANAHKLRLQVAVSCSDVHVNITSLDVTKIYWAFVQK